MTNPDPKSQAVANLADKDAATRLEALNIRHMKRAQEIVKTLDGVEIGYIGSVYMDGTDDRSWFIFLPHPGRVGEPEDRIGGFATSERGRLLPLLNALAMGIALGRDGAQSRAIPARLRPVQLPHF